VHARLPAAVGVGPVETEITTSEAEGLVEVCVSVNNGSLGADVIVFLTAMNRELASAQGTCTIARSMLSGT
jgi:hypothetical protein